MGNPSDNIAALKTKQNKTITKMLLFLMRTVPEVRDRSYSAVD